MQVQVDADGGERQIAVRASANSCSWTASSAANWVTVGPSRHNGSGAVTLRIEPQTGLLPRQGRAQVAGADVTITQAGAPLVEEVRLNGRARNLTGDCPAFTFRVDGRLVRTTLLTQFNGTRCGRLAEGRMVEVRGLTQLDGSVLAARVRVNGEDDR